ncbi:MAG: HlyC/CorC family transporter [Verrucomicrobiae bacterium]|nr:HlyC/CorC family transporter [Verrucomicrobiae bacterium]
MLIVKAIFAAASLAGLWLASSIAACEAILIGGPTRLRLARAASETEVKNRASRVRLLGPIHFASTAINSFTLAAATAFGVLTESQGWPWWVFPAAIAVLLLVFGDLLPKALVRDDAARPSARCLAFIARASERARPFFERMDAIAARWVRRFVPRSGQALPGLTEEEYLTLLDLGTREGALRPSERKLIEHAIQLGERNLREMMTPRTQIRYVDVAWDLARMRTEAIASRHRRLPICDGSLDSVVGILNVRRFLLEKDSDPIACFEPAAFVPETMSALELLKSFLRGPQRIALVLDEFGGVDGLITMEAVVEEIFGEISDEYDDSPPPWEEIEEGILLARGSASLRRVSDRLGVKLAAEGADTLGGWITDRLGAIPRAGDACAHGGWSFQVERANRNRVEAVLVRDERGRRR